MGEPGPIAVRRSGIRGYFVSQRLFTVVAVFVIVLAAPAASAARRARVTEFPLPTAGSQPTGITSGPDGALWFTEPGALIGTGNRIGRITTAGSVTEFALPATPPAEASNAPWGIAVGSDGALWFTERGTGNIGRITTTGSVTEFPLPTPLSFPSGMTAGPDGARWFTEPNGGRIGRITTAGSISELLIPATCCPDPAPKPSLRARTARSGSPTAALRTQLGGSRPAGHSPSSRSRPNSGEPGAIAAGPDGALWFTIQTGFNDGGAIGRMTTAGTFNEYSIPTPAAGITAGPRGSLWFTASGDQVGRVTTTGRIGEIRTPTAGSVPVAITTAPDGNLWFTESSGNKIGRLTPDRLPSEAFVEGEIHTQPPCSQPGCVEQPRYIFDVTNQPIGKNARGTVTYQTGERFGLTTQTGSVTCLYTKGNRATVGVNFGPTEPGGSGPRSALIFLEDNGPVAADMFAVEDLPAGTAPSTCPKSPPAGITLGPAYPGDAAPASGVTITYLPRLP